jgi:hypothetical protein
MTTAVASGSWHAFQSLGRKIQVALPRSAGPRSRRAPAASGPGMSWLALAFEVTTKTRSGATNRIR